VPLLLLAIAAWQNFRLVRSQAEERVMIEVGELREHALNTIKTYAIVLAWIDARMRGLDWDRIEHDEELRRFLSDLDTLPQIDEVWMADAAGHPRVSGRPSPISVIDVSERDCFAAEQQRDVGIFVGHEQTGALAHVPEFDICERRSTADRAFDGIIVVSARSAYFGEFYRTVSEDQHFAASLVRSDGSLLVRYPTLPAPSRLARSSPFMQAIASNPDRGLFWGRGETDGIERFYGYQRIEGYPLYVAYGIPKNDVLASWLANLFNYSLFAVPASLALFGMTLLAVRQIQRRTIASWRWRTTARRLRREMNRRTLAEAELHQAQKMEALGQLTGGVAHDFNNLLTVLQGSLEMLSGRQQNDQLQARVDTALRTVERGERLTEQLLAFARRQPLVLATIDLSAQLPGGGALRIRTFNRAVPAGGAPEQPIKVGDFVGLEISDTGHGMPPDVAARAFEPFFTTKEAGKGTGLGLSMVYGFARQSGGSASIRSDVGRGTAVTLLLPRRRLAPEADRAGATDLLQGAST